MAGENTQRLDFTAATIHDLKTSLTAIIASAELLAEELQPDEKSVLGRLIQSIRRNAQSIDEKLSLLAEAGSLLANKPEFQPEPVKIGQVIHDVAAQLYPETKSRRQSLILDAPDSLPPVRADRRHLEQILLCLVSNASKFTGEEGQIKVSARQEGTDLIVQVSDTGIGIPAEEQERIFQPYYRINRDKGRQNVPLSRERRYSGSGLGLGLTIAKSLVELHGGKIWLKSRVGQGSSFFFSLPMVAPVESSRS